MPAGRGRQGTPGRGRNKYRGTEDWTHLMHFGNGQEKAGGGHKEACALCPGDQEFPHLAARQDGLVRFL